MYKRGQGTIEYLVILAVIVVVSLVVVSLLVNSTSGAEGISSGTSQIASTTSPISIAESVVSEDGNYLLKIGNNTGENVTVKTVSVGDSVTSSELGKVVPVSGEQVFVLSSSDVCVGGQQVVDSVSVTYVTVNGLEKTQVYPVPVNFSCETFGINTSYIDETGTEFDEEGNEIGGNSGPTILQVTGETLVGGVVQNFPMLTSSGETINNLSELEQAYANEDIVIYASGIEQSVSPKEASSLLRFQPISEWDGTTEGSDYIDITMDDCYALDPYKPVDNKYVRFVSVSSGYESYLNTNYRMIPDDYELYINDCAYCWGSGSCTILEGFEINNNDGMSETTFTSTWFADIYDFKLTYGASSEENTIQINPVTGEIQLNGLNGDITIDYYYESA